MKNKKPKYWVVRNDGSKLFKDTVVNKMNAISISGRQWKGKTLKSYYGYDGNTLPNKNGTNVSTSLGDFENNPTLLTLDEFIELLTEQVFEKLNIKS